MNPRAAHSGVRRKRSFPVTTHLPEAMYPEWADELSGPGAPAASQAGLASPPASQPRNESAPGSSQNNPPATPSTSSNRNGNTNATTPASASRNRTAAQEVRRMALLECL